MNFTTGRLARCMVEGGAGADFLDWELILEHKWLGLTVLLVENHVKSMMVLNVAMRTLGEAVPLGTLVGAGGAVEYR